MGAAASDSPTTGRGPERLLSERSSSHGEQGEHGGLRRSRSALGRFLFRFLWAWQVTVAERAAGCSCKHTDVCAAISETRGSLEDSGGTGPRWSCAGPLKAWREFPFGGIAAAVAAERAEQQPKSCGWESNPKRIQRREPGRKR
ncbi:hypothetical protein NDU88_003449 [Pleurodeles waltl]|uniref:Uncharacterized protein n=1 Tax=Pleurodeles waltl TaxID=8319 RepID=A0AAV7T540_PLEWA|nr:hypothetical protein NDU88_003449 [Pleurodeles waltl]